MPFYRGKTPNIFPQIPPSRDAIIPIQPHRPQPHSIPPQSSISASAMQVPATVLAAALLAFPSVSADAGPDAVHRRAEPGLWTREADARAGAEPYTLYGRDALPDAYPYASYARRGNTRPKSSRVTLLKAVAAYPVMKAMDKWHMNRLRKGQERDEKRRKNDPRPIPEMERLPQWNRI